MTTKKILITGYQTSGKTALVNRFVKNRYTNSYQSDVQLTVDKKNVTVNKKDVTLVFWTTPGAASQLKSFKSFYLGTDALVHVIDVNKPSSFADLDRWISHYKKHLPSTPVYLACNKIEENINLDCSAYFENFDCYRIFFTSAKNNFMVSDLFIAIAADLIDEPYSQKIKIY
jgi:small GTP-binding protein